MTPTRLGQQHRGMSLLETMISVAILLVALAAIMSLFTVAVSQNANQGEFATRATEYAQDKMEQLLALAYGDGNTNTAVYPTTPTGGTGLGGLSISVGNFVGSVDTNAPVTNYTDYLDGSGNLLPLGNTGSWFYKRQWRIDQVQPGMKRLSVIAIVRAQAGGGTILPSTTLVSLKANLP
jgi:prepilin-type N-terminal cleavage/methylation domain-containing protein